jgi:hypothetical protein
MDTAIAALKAVAAMATVIIEPENLSRMMISLCLAMRSCTGSCSTPAKFATLSFVAGKPVLPVRGPHSAVSFLQPAERTAAKPLSPENSLLSSRLKRA